MNLKLNVKKTKLMVAGSLKEEHNIAIDGEKVEQVESFKYLGSMKTATAACSGDIKSRIAIAKCVSWKEKRTNASIFSELDAMKELLGKIMTLKLVYFGHIIRGSGSPLTLQIVEGMVEGKRKRGRQKKSWFDNIREWTRLSYMRAKRSAQNRSAWRRTIKKCAEGGCQSSGVTAVAR